MTDVDHGVHVRPNWNPGMPLSSPARTVDVTIDNHGYHLDHDGVDGLIARLTAAREQTWPPEGPTSRRECSLPDCSWYHDEPDWPLSMALMPVPRVEQIEEARRIFGEDEADPVRDANLANLLIYTQRVEGVLREHFKTHPWEDWALEVLRLQAKLAEIGDIGASADPEDVFVPGHTYRSENGYFEFVCERQIGEYAIGIETVLKEWPVQPGMRFRKWATVGPSVGYRDVTGQESDAGS